MNVAIEYRLCVARFVTGSHILHQFPDFDNVPPYMDFQKSSSNNCQLICAYRFTGGTDNLDLPISSIPFFNNYNNTDCS